MPVVVVVAVIVAVVVVVVAVVVVAVVVVQGEQRILKLNDTLLAAIESENTHDPNVLQLIDEGVLAFFPNPRVR